MPGDRRHQPSTPQTKRRTGRWPALAAGILIAWATGPLVTSVAADGYGAKPADLSHHLAKLVRAYPDFISSYDADFVIMKNGQKYKVSDGRSTKSFDQMLEDPDIDDMFYAPYPAGQEPKPPPKNSDPGRVRYEPLFVAMYGDCYKGEVTTRLRNINWLPRHGGGTVSVTTVNGVDKALERVSAELDRLPKEDMKYLKPSAGTYACRSIAGSRARSMHAYGAAIDLNLAVSHYWRWSGGPRVWRNSFPKKIIDVFERNGFIWGGRWYHFDTMHFEYRPELLPDAPRR